MANELAFKVVRRLREAGYAAYLVGGCVRDLLLGLTPKDYDIATAAIVDEVRAVFPGSNLVGAQFGVVLVREGKAQVEVATFRSDLEYADGRRPSEVTFEQDPRKDAWRRDFTINALLLDTERDEVLDYVGGRADLESRTIRAIGDPPQRFREDHLRLLRAIRFAARLEFTIEPTTWAAIREHAELIRSVSAERVRDEISRMLTEAHPRRAFELLDETGLLDQILPEISAMKGVEQPPEFHPEGDVWRHTMSMLDCLEKPSLTLAWGVLLHDVGKPATFVRAADRIRFNGHVEEGVQIAREILGRLRYSQDEIAQVSALVANHMKFKDVPQMKESTVKRFLRQPAFEEHMALHRLDCLSSHGSLENYELVKRKLEETPPEQLKPAPLLSGVDLIKAGYRPGPYFGKALQAVEEAQLNGEIRTAEGAMRVAQGVLDSVRVP